MDRIKQLEEFLASSPGDSFLQHALALEYMKQGKDDVAAELFEALLEKDPGYVGSYYQLGKLAESKGDMDKAKAVYLKGMKIAGEIQDRHSYNELQAAYEDISDE